MTLLHRIETAEAGSRKKLTDPVERVIQDALEDAGIPYDTGDGGGKTKGLDFYLPTVDVYIECKRLHTPRISAQMKRAKNVIAVQGMTSAKFLAAILRAKGVE